MLISSSTNNTYSRCQLSIKSAICGRINYKESNYPRFVLNRTVLILAYKQPFLDWLNAAEQNPLSLTLEMLGIDNDSFLIPQFDDPRHAVKWAEERWSFLFDSILFDWATEESMWPENRSLKMFLEWFDIDVHSMVWDLVNEPLLVEDWGIDDESVDFEHPDTPKPNLH